MRNLKYVMVVEPMEDEGGAYYCAYFPDLPGCTTMGRSMEEIRGNARTAIELYIGALREKGEPIPAPQVHSEEIAVEAS